MIKNRPEQQQELNVPVGLRDSQIKAKNITMLDTIDEKSALENIAIVSPKSHKKTPAENDSNTKKWGNHDN